MHLDKLILQTIINNNQVAIGEINCVDEPSLISALHKILYPYLYDAEAYLMIMSGPYEGFIGKIWKLEEESGLIWLKEGLEIRRCKESEVKPVNVLI